MTDHPVKPLPKVYVFVDQYDLWGTGNVGAMALAEDGTIIGTHICSDESWIAHDLVERPYREAAIRAHYPDGCQLVYAPPPPEVRAKPWVMPESDVERSAP